jgi:hypothetical protein
MSKQLTILHSSSLGWLSSAYYWVQLIEPMRPVSFFPIVYR